MLCVAVGSWWEHSPGIATSLIVRQNASEMVSEDGKGVKPLSRGKPCFVLTSWYLKYTLGHSVRLCVTWAY